MLESTVVPELFAVIGNHDDQAVFPAATALQRVSQSAELSIDERQLAVIAGDEAGAARVIQADVSLCPEMAKPTISPCGLEVATAMVSGPP